MMSNLRNIDAEIVSQNGGMGRLVAAGAGDATKITGVTLDRYGALGKQSYQSAQVVVVGHAVLATGQSLAAALEYQDSADGSSWNTAVPMYTSTNFLTDPGGGSTRTGQKSVGLNMEGLQRFVRFNVTPDLTAGGTDTAEIAVVAIFGGGRVLPAD